MKVKRIGFVGWRGLVGSVLMSRMIEEGDFKEGPEYVFFSTSQAGQKVPEHLGEGYLKDAYDAVELRRCDIIVSCQGSEWTNKVHPGLRKGRWEGILLDASSALRMESDSIIVLDPLNKENIIKAVKDDKKVFCGGNCTVSLMLMAIHGLIKEDLVMSIISDTYQAASGAGAKHMIELIQQLRHVSSVYDPSFSALELERQVAQSVKSLDLPRGNFGVPLALSLIPLIDDFDSNGHTREEIKGYDETNKILERKDKKIPIDGTCVRIGSMRCHSQALTIELRSNVAIKEVEEIIAKANNFVKVVPNEKEATKNFLTPTAVTGTDTIAIGRIKASRLSSRTIHAFTVGDQLLWGAAEPIRRALRIILENL